MGRFTSQDSFLGAIDSPPSLHRYFYANANPTRYVDLTGHSGTTAAAAMKANPGFGTVDPQRLELLLTPFRMAAQGIYNFGLAAHDFAAAAGFKAWEGYPSKQAPYKEAAERHYSRAEKVDEAFSTPENLLHAAASTVSAPIEQMVQGYEQGSGVQMTEGLTGLGLELYGARPSQLPSVRFTGTPPAVLSTGEVVAGTGEMTLSMPGGSVPAGTYLASKTNQPGVVVKESPSGDAAKGKVGPKHETGSPTTAEPAKADPKQQAPATGYKPAFDPKAGRLRDPQTGQFVSDPANPPSPYGFTDAQRTAAWRRLAQDPNSGLSAAERAEIKERGWRGPQRKDLETGEPETMELSHEPIPLREGGTEVVPRWPPDHAAVDPHRQLKKKE